MADDVRDLVSRCLAGSQTAIAELVDRFRGQVFGLCYRMVGHRQDAEDMAQESFVRALRSLSSWDNQRDFTPWLLAIAGNRCRSLLTSRKRCPRPTDQLEQVADRSPDVHAARHLAEEVHRALAGLREDYRQVFLLFHEQHLSYAQIAEVVGCPLGTVKTWVHRARQELARKLIQRGAVEELTDEVRPI